MSEARSLNRSLKRWPAWVLMAVLAASLLAVGATRDTGPQSQEDRVDEITKRLACPVCDGESVFESQNNSSRSIRTEVASLVRENELSDDEIIAVFEARDADILLVPKSTGIEALAWMLPVIALCLGLIGLAFAFRRWRVEAESLRDPTDDDRALVAEALAAGDRDAVAGDPGSTSGSSGAAGD